MAANNRGSTAAFRVVGSLFLWAAVATGAFVPNGSAAEAPPTAASPSRDDAIAAAKRDLAAIKAATNPAADTGSASGPHISLPEFHGDEAAPIVPEKPVVAPKADDKRSANWLVDAMLNPKPDPSKTRGRESTGNRSLADDVRMDRSKSASTPRDATDVEAAESGDQVRPSDTTSRNPSDPVFNPLAKYMADWMTPKDYALLKPGLEKTSAGELPNVGSDPGQVGASNSIELAALATLGGDAPDSPHSASLSGKAADNPFLAGLNAPEPNPAAVTVQPAVPASPAPLNPPPLPPPSVSKEDNSVIPDFAKSNSDDKYFKPLKRF